MYNRVSILGIIRFLLQRKDFVGTNRSKTNRLVNGSLIVEAPKFQYVVLEWWLFNNVKNCFSVCLVQNKCPF